jgi:hypothetical protein
MALARRDFLKRGALVALSATMSLKLPGTAAGQQQQHAAPQSLMLGFDIPYESQTNAIIYFRKSTFSPYLNSKFGVRLRNSKVMQVGLVRVADVGPVEGRKEDAAIGKESFSIRFSAPTYSKPIPQDTYTMTHGALGTFQLFLVPMGKDSKGQYYEAIINHRQS